METHFEMAHIPLSKVGAKTIKFFILLFFNEKWRSGRDLGLWKANEFNYEKKEKTRATR